MTSGRNPRRHSGVRPVLCALVIFCGSARAGSQNESREYIGAETCRLCHRAIYESWLETPHASSRLESDAEQRCWRCHATNEGRLERVQCESCHGAGVNYWPAEVMIDLDKAAMAGLLRPAAATCARCHDTDEPGHVAGFAMPPRAEWSQWIHDLREPER